MIDRQSDREMIEEKESITYGNIKRVKFSRTNLARQ